MNTLPSGLTRESHVLLAVGALVFAIIVILFASFLQLGVENCATGNQLTYCGGGPPLLGVMVYILTGLSFLFGLNATFASKHGWATIQESPGTRRAFARPVVRRIVGLTLLLEGAGLAAMGLLMTPNICLPIEGPCEFPPYVLTGIPLALVLVGGAVIAFGLAVVLLGMVQMVRERHRREGPTLRVQ